MEKEAKLQISPVSNGKRKCLKVCKDSKSPFDNAICSLCQASGRMIAVQCFRLADGLTLVVERQGFKNVPKLRDLDMSKAAPVFAFMNFVEVPDEIKEKIEDESQEI